MSKQPWAARSRISFSRCNTLESVDRRGHKNAPLEPEESSGRCVLWRQPPHGLSFQCAKTRMVQQNPQPWHPNDGGHQGEHAKFYRGEVIVIEESQFGRNP